VAIGLARRYSLEEVALTRMEEFEVCAPWQVYVQIRLRIYEEMLADPEVLRGHTWPHTVALLKEVRMRGYRAALATVSHCRQVWRILEALDITSDFEFIATQDDVERSKPDPEIYELVSEELGVDPAACLVIEDSPSGVRAALEAGMWCIAVPSPFTRAGLESAQLLHPRWVVKQPSELQRVFEDMIAEREKE